MTTRELSLARDLVARARMKARLAAQREAAEWHEDRLRRGIATDRCVYCGKTRWHGSVACHLHRDLPALDPKFNREALEAAA